MKTYIFKLGFLIIFGLLNIQSSNDSQRYKSEFQLNISKELEKEIQQQFTFIQKEIDTKLKWYDKISEQTYNKQSLILITDKDPVDVILRRTNALIIDLKKNSTNKISSLEKTFKALSKNAKRVSASNIKKRKDLFKDVFMLRREISFSNSLLDFNDIIFTASHSSAGDFHMCDQYYGVFARPGGGILQLKNAFGENPEIINIFKDKTVKEGRLKGRDLSNGMFLAPSLSYDGTKITFSYSECARDLDKQTPYRTGTSAWSKESSFHIFSANIDGSNLVQLTDGGWNDITPAWMPDGRIVFISERRGGFLRCSGDRPCPNYTLHAMNADGTDIVRLSHHETNEWHPSINNEGMLLYTRWDYVDRGDDQAHHPWITTPDGRNPKAIQGNYKNSHQDNPDMEVYVRAIPNSNKYISLAAPHHGGSYGTLIIIDPSVKDDDSMAPVKRLTPEDGFPEARMTNPEEYKKSEKDNTFRLSFNGQNEPAKKMFSATWALSENYFLTTMNKKLYLIDAFGNRELIYSIPGMYCLGPVPVKKQPKPTVIPSQSKPLKLADNTEYTEVGDEHPIDKSANAYSDNAKVVLLDVYNSLYPFPEGTKIKELRIVQVLQKTTPVHQKPAIGYGAETPARAILGTVPVEEDGSAYFYLPPGKSVYFQAIDEKGEALQSMRSATYVQGGESISCIGCHEPKHNAPDASKSRVLALKRSPSPIKPEITGTNPFSYPLLVQPILDKHCISCHDGADKKHHAFDLSAGDWRKDRYKWYASYRNLSKYAWHHGSFKTGYDLWLSPRSKPGEIGAKASLLLPMLKKGHGKTTLSEEEMHAIVLWLDSNSDFFGSYKDIEKQSKGEVVIPEME